MSLEATIQEAVRTAVLEVMAAHTTPVVLTLEPRIYSGAEACKLLKMDTATFYAKLGTGEIRGTREGRNWSVSSVALFDFILAREGRAGVLRLDGAA
jgi:hypothetical protein